MEKVGLFSLAVILLVLGFRLPTAVVGEFALGRWVMPLLIIIVLLLGFVALVVMFFKWPEDKAQGVLLAFLALWAGVYLWTGTYLHNDYKDHLCVDTGINQYVRETPEVRINNPNVVCYKDNADLYHKVKP